MSGVNSSKFKFRSDFTNKDRTHTDRETNFKQADLQRNGQPCMLDINTSEKTVDTCCDKSFIMWISHGVYTMDACEYTNHVLRNPVRSVITYSVKCNWAALTCIIMCVIYYTYIYYTSLSRDIKHLCGHTLFFSFIDQKCNLNITLYKAV